jgi:glutaredoxin-like YruB-family protein
METIQSLDQLHKKLNKNQKVYLLLYKSGSGLNECALNNVKEAAQNMKNVALFSADVLQVRDIHPHYGIDSVPSLVEIDRDTMYNIIRGCNTVSFYKNVFEKGISQTTFAEGYKSQPRVTLYTTPTCPYCVTMKNYLKAHNIYYTDIDVSKDQNAAQDMFRKSGRQGVPQADINGEMVVGFDKTTINRLLDIKG